MSPPASPPCPSWSDDKAEHQDPAFASRLAGVVRIACKNARSAVPSTDDVMTWHRVAFEAVVPVDYYAGNPRQIDPRRPCLEEEVGVLTANGQIIPGSASKDVLTHFTALFVWVRQQADAIDLRWPTLSATKRTEALALLVAYAVGEFVKIHPFRNGNGRTSRVLWAVLLCRYGLRWEHSIRVRPEPPYGDIMRASMTGNHKPIFKAVLHAIAEAPPATQPTPKIVVAP